MLIFNETIYYNNREMEDDLLYVSSCGLLMPDENYVVAREGSKTAVFACVLSGEAYIEYNGRMEKLKKGDCYLFPSYTKNKIETNKLNPHSMLWINCRGRLLDSLIRSYFDTSQPIIAMHSIESEFHKIAALLRSTANERASDETALLIHKMLLDMKGSLRKSAHSTPASHSPLEDQIESYISNHIQQRFSIAGLCAAFHLSDRQLASVFKRKYRSTPYAYYLSKKMELATAMLKDSNLSIDAIAERLNFADRNHFTKLYIKRTGSSPARFRRSAGLY